jgi:hypothetical protein
VSRLAADQTQLLRALARHGVEFVVVRGVAAQVHGWRGATADLDIAVSTEGSNVERLSLALASVGAGNGTIGAFGTVFATRCGRLELVRRAHAIGHYPDWLRGAREHRLDEGLTVVVAAPDDILRSKEAAAREKDVPRCRKCARTSSTPGRSVPHARRRANGRDSYKPRGRERGWEPGGNRSRPVVTSRVPSCPRSEYAVCR